MKKLLLILLACSVLTITGCSSDIPEFKRISYNRQSLNKMTAEYFDDATRVNYLSEMDFDQFPSQLPVYKISKSKISKDDYLQLLDHLGLGEQEKAFSLNENIISGDLVEIPDHRGYVLKSENEIQTAAMQTFQNTSYYDEEYKCVGITSTDRFGDKDGEHIVRVGVSFLRKKDGIQIIGNDSFELYFDGSGLEGVYIESYDYTSTGTMELIPVEEAAGRIKSPDSFNIDETGLGKEMQKIDTLEVQKVNLYWVNQYSKGCDVLQPVYCFSGIATDINGTKAPFDSIVIAVPESYTQE